MSSILRNVALLANLVFWLVSCSPGGDDQLKASFGQEFTLRVGRTASVNDGEVVIKFESVTGDSRCPKGVTCIWAGEARCQMQVTSKGSPANVSFTAAGGTDGYSRSVFNNYTADFKLEPYPEAGKQIAGNEYLMLLRITRLGPES